MRLSRRLLAAAVLSLPAASLQAAQVGRVDIVGLDEAMEANVRLSLSVVEAIGRDLSGRRLAYLVREADDEAREALQPFGYYAPQITVERTRGDGPVVVTVAIVPGVPVRVRAGFFDGLPGPPSSGWSMVNDGSGHPRQTAR